MLLLQWNSHSILIDALSLNPNWIPTIASDHSTIFDHHPPTSDLAHHLLYRQPRSSPIISCAYDQPLDVTINAYITHITSTRSTAALSHVPATSTSLVHLGSALQHLHAPALYANYHRHSLWPYPWPYMLYNDIIQTPALPRCLWLCTRHQPLASLHHQLAPLCNTFTCVRSSLPCPHIPGGFQMEWFHSTNYPMDSTYYHMDSTLTYYGFHDIPHGIHNFPHGFHTHLLWIPQLSTWIPHGFHIIPLWNP